MPGAKFSRDVRLCREVVEQRATLGIFQIDGEAALVAVECGKEACGETDEAPSRIAAGRLDLDHVGAEIGEDQAGTRSHDGVTEFEHADAGERQCIVLGALG